MFDVGTGGVEVVVVGHDLALATDQLEEEYMVADISSISDFIPTPQEQQARLAQIRRIREMPQRYRELEYTAADVERLSDEIQRLEWNIIEIGDLSVAGLGEENKILATRNRMIREIFGAEVGRPGEELFQSLITVLLSDPERMALRLTRIDAGPSLPCKASNHEFSQ